MNKQRERRALDNLLRLEPAIPRGEIVPSEKPDFIIDAAEYRLGIEVTEYFRPEKIGRSPVQMQEALTRKICGPASALCAAADLPYLWAVVTFDRGHALIKHDVEALAQALFALIADLGERHIDDEQQLPPGVVELTVHHIGAEHVVAPMGTLWPPDLDLNELRAIIAKKERRLSSYRTRCDVVWLLIAVDGFRLSSATLRPRKVESQASAFDRIILLYDNDAVIEVPRS
jgi:hypothetical protein